MKEGVLSTIACKNYWDQIIKWSNATDGIYYSGNVGIGETNPSKELDVVGDILASGTICDSTGCIGNIGSQSVNYATSAGDADKLDGHDTSYFMKNEITLSEEKSVDAYNYDSGHEIVSTPLGKWDFCFLTRFDRSGKGGDLREIKKSRCELTESSGEWTLTAQSDNKGHTRCGARCVNFGGAPAVVVPPAPTSFFAIWACYQSVCGVQLGWVDVDNETGYEIRRNGSFLSSPPPNIEWAFDVNVNLGTAYYYQIKACNNAGCSGWSSISITTPTTP